MKEMILVLDFGGQYNQLIARRVRENNVYCEVHNYSDEIIDKLKSLKPRGIILTGGPQSVYADDSIKCKRELFELGIPTLGICYGAQAMTYALGGSVEKAEVSEYGKTELLISDDSQVVIDVAKESVDWLVSGKSKLFEDVENNSTVWMSHTDRITKVPEGFVVTASTANCPIAALEDSSKNLYAVQFHPEVVHTVEGKKIFSNFVDICGCSRDWRMDSFAEDTINQLKAKIGGKKALCALSGGVDSSVAAVMMSRCGANALRAMQGAFAGELPAKMLALYNDVLDGHQNEGLEHEVAIQFENQGGSHMTHIIALKDAINLAVDGEPGNGIDPYKGSFNADEFGGGNILDDLVGLASR